MKKIIKPLGIVAVASILLASCSGPKSDANKMCKMACACQRLSDKNSDKAESCIHDLQELSSEIFEKYGDDRNASDIINEALLNCKCLRDR